MTEDHNDSDCCKTDGNGDNCEDDDNDDDTQVGTLEGTLFLQSGNLVRLSQQALVDCRYICHHDDQHRHHHHHDQPYHHHHHRVRHHHHFKRSVIHRLY